MQFAIVYTLSETLVTKIVKLQDIVFFFCHIDKTHFALCGICESQSVLYRTEEQEVSGLIPELTNFFPRIVIVTGLIPLSLMTIDLMMLM